MEFESGELTQGHAYLELLLDFAGFARNGPTGQIEQQSYAAIVASLAARSTADTQHLEVAVSAAETVLSAGQVEPIWSAQARAGLALVAVESRDSDAALSQYDALEQYRGTLLFTAGVSFDRLLGLLCGTMGRRDDASAHFEEALSFCRKADYGPELGWACCDYAEVLLQGNGPSSAEGADREKALSLLNESLAISRELGMRPLTERVLTRRESLTSQPSPRAQGHSDYRRATIMYWLRPSGSGPSRSMPASRKTADS